MKLNLKPFNIKKITFSSTCLLPKEILSSILPKDEENSSVLIFYDSYTIERVSHHVKLTLRLRNEDKSEYHLEFEYSITKRKVQIPTGIPKIDDRILKLCKLEKEHDFTCSINIEYNKKENRKFFIDLPIKLSDNAPIPIKIIDGFSFEGTIESIDYSALLWMDTPDGKMNLIIIFAKKYIFDISLTQKIIDDSQKISNSLLPQLRPERKRKK